MMLESLLAAAAAVGVELVEQPLPAGKTSLLAAHRAPVPVCADESVHDRASLATLAERYDAVNIKLDKTGGLTEALLLAAGGPRTRAQDHGRQHGRDLARHGPCPARSRKTPTGSISTDRCCSRATACQGSPMTAAMVFPPPPELWG